MQSPLYLCILSLALTGMTVADLPKKPPISHYNKLWTDSPFTSKPPPVAAGPENNPLDDYSLIGVSSIGGTGYRVTLINKKLPTERITVDSDKERNGFKILGVTRKTGDPLGTVVNMSSGSMIGTVSFDQKLLTLATPPPKANIPQPQPGQEVQNLPPGENPPQRQPRPRVVPPPVPQVPGQPPQPQQIPQTNIQRPMRRTN